MSKYTLKLEKLVQTNSFGNILITVQFDNHGPKLITLLGEHLTENTRYLTDKVLNFVNFMLSKNIDSYEIANLLVDKLDEEEKTELDDILKILSSSVLEAPNSLQGLNPDILMSVSPDMVDEYAQSLNSSDNQEILSQTSSFSKPDALETDTANPVQENHSESFEDTKIDEEQSFDQAIEHQDENHDANQNQEHQNHENQNYFN